jgi:Zn-dependent protease
MVTFVSILVLWVISLCLHEYSHARVAYAGGDLSVAEKGYLSLNPLRYMHPFMSIVLPILILAIGGIPLPGGAVYIDTSRLRSRHWESAVSAAGPAANVVVMIVCALPFTLGIADLGDGTTLWPMLALFCAFQALAAALNLIPLPGLDGFGIISPYLPRDVQIKTREIGNSGISFFVLIAIMWTDNPISDLVYGSMLHLPEALGVPAQAIGLGYLEFKSVLG